MISIRIPSPLRTYTDGLKEVKIVGDTVGSAIASLAQQYPGVRPHLFDEHGTLRSYVNLFVNNEDIRHLEGPATPITEQDRLMIIPSIAGGVYG
jgi:molybdopterin converting factor small subunit